jgi:mannose-6-phosphate isomerase-like protein (cupin superfamily)
VSVPPRRQAVRLGPLLTGRGNALRWSDRLRSSNIGGPPQHRHGRHDESFYVVASTARFTVGEESYKAPTGTLVVIPPGAPHTFANDSDEPVILLNTFTPDLYVQYFRDLRGMVASGSRPTAGQVADVMARYETEPATTYAALRQPHTCPSA